MSKNVYNLITASFNPDMISSANDQPTVYQPEKVSRYIREYEHSLVEFCLKSNLMYR